ncbi:MAG: hypothetical protein ACK5NT_01905 [Pyrinomonadaceae bacterium]
MHLVKTGGEISYETLSSFSQDNMYGTYFFSNYRDFELNKPLLFTQRIGSNRANTSQTNLALFIQDYFKPSDYAQVGVGLRYQIQTGLRDRNNFSPRFSFVLSPESSGKSILRGGVGIVYLEHKSSVIANIKMNDGTQSDYLIIPEPGYPNPFSTTIPLRALSQVKSVYYQAPELTNPLIYTGLFSGEYSINESTFLKLGYLFFRGTNEFKATDINAPVDGVRPEPNIGRIE